MIQSCASCRRRLALPGRRHCQPCLNRKVTRARRFEIANGRAALPQPLTDMQVADTIVARRWGPNEAGNRAADQQITQCPKCDARTLNPTNHPCTRQKGPQ